MKKISLLLIIILSVVGAMLIYRYFEKHQSANTITKKANNDYSLVTDSILINKSIDEINMLFNKKSGIVFLCIKENEWCNYYAKYLNEVVKENEINEIYYLNIKQDRSYNTSGYRKLVNNIKEYLIKDDENNLRIFVPTTLFIKDGIVIGYDNETSIMIDNISPSEYYTEEKINEFKYKLSNFILNFKEEAL